jgi:hypothetical protein
MRSNIERMRPDSGVPGVGVFSVSVRTRAMVAGRALAFD